MPDPWEPRTAHPEVEECQTGRTRVVASETGRFGSKCAGMAQQSVEVGNWDEDKSIGEKASFPAAGHGARQKERDSPDTAELAGIAVACHIPGVIETSFAGVENSDARTAHREYGFHGHDRLGAIHGSGAGVAD